MSNAIYAAIDGSWGEAAGIVIVDTSRWELVDYNLFDEVHALNVPNLARLIADWNDDGRPTDQAYLDRFDELGVAEKWVFHNARRSEE